jgi:hypothetical protein
MWVLESEGDVLRGKILHELSVTSDHADEIEGKKLWLRPGKKFLFGRTKAEGTVALLSI